MPTPSPAPEPGRRGAPTGPPHTAGAHHPTGHCLPTYSLWLLTVLALGLAVAAVTALPSPAAAGLLAGRTAPGTGARDPVAEPVPLPAKPPPTVTITLEAESARLGPKLSVVAMAGASGGGVVVNVGRNKRSLTFPRVTVPAGGRYHLGLFYASTQRADLHVDSSGGTGATVACPATGSTATIRQCDATIVLAAGANQVTISAETRPVTLDRISVW